MQTGDLTNERLEKIWALERQCVRRMLIGLTRDIDLADDLLQETYLKARNGISAYRGDNNRAWLCTIARNAYFAHLRRRYVHAETGSEDAEHTPDSSPVGTPGHLELISIRTAISQLDSGLRTALLMKHYCGFTYHEIAEHTQCPVGTAKWRVSAAIGKLKEALGVTEEAVEIQCADLSRNRLLDYLYGSIMPDQTEAIERHLRKCLKCRNNLDGNAKILSALDALESECKVVQIIELDTDGMPTLYATFKSINTSDQSISEISFCATKSCNVEYISVQGEELAFTSTDNDDPNYPETYAYHAQLPNPINPGEAADFLNICRPDKKHAAVKQDDGTWKFRWSQLTSVEHESALVVAIRIPPGAQLVSADPSNFETAGSGATIVWRRVLAANQGFGCKINYMLSEDIKKEEERMLRHQLVSSLFALALLLPFSSMVGAAAPVKPVAVTEGSLSVNVDPRIELISIVQYLSDYKDSHPHLVTRLGSGYREEIDKQFSKFKGHRAVEMFGKMSSEGFTYDAPPHTVLYLNADFSLDPVMFEDYSMGVQRAGGKERMQEFADALKTLAEESEFAEFFNSHTGFYKKITEATFNSIDNKNVVGVLEDYYGDKRSSFSIVISPLLGQGAFGPQVEREKGRRETYCIMGPYGEQNGVPVFGSPQFFDQLQRHEFGHSFVNPLTDTHSDIYEKYSNLFAPMKQTMKRQAYGDWRSVVNESIIRAVTTRLAYRLDGEEAGNKELQDHKNRGFIFTDALVKKLEEYEQNRAKYPTLDSFYPELLKALDGFSESSVAEMLKSTDLVINDLVMGAKCLIYDLPDDDGRSPALDGITRVHERFFSKIEMVDVKKINDDYLREKGDFVLYTTIGSKLFNAATQPLNIKIDGDTLNWNGVSAPVSELRIILAGSNPCGPGKCVIYAAGSNKLLNGINGCFHGPRSYHIFQGDKLLKEGDYNDRFALRNHE